MIKAGLVRDMCDAVINSDSFEGLTWHNAAKPLRPDVDIRVLGFSRENGVLMVVWDDGCDHWFDVEVGLAIEDITHWAEPMGPGA